MKPSTTAEPQRAAKVLARLKAAYPDAGCELRHWRTPFELAVAAILSAQCTDERVNRLTPTLFRAHPTPADWAALSQEQLEAEIRPTGFFRNKARNIRELAKVVVERYGGQLPSDFDTLVQLPGIGRKTANLIVATAFGGQGIIVDTHCARVSRRLGFVDDDDPVRIEFRLRELIPPTEWSVFSHCMVIHGRRCCTARRPACERCPVADLCPSAQTVARRRGR
ncbi:MAG: endonuclease III [Kiritimatiellae bacterium]|nr:endonuclease III [Kiritimatiellia bacterium]